MIIMIINNCNQILLIESILEMTKNRSSDLSDLFSN